MSNLGGYKVLTTLTKVVRARRWFQKFLPSFKAGDTFLLKRTPEQDDFYHMMNGRFCGEAWDAISRYVYTALQGGSIMHKCA